MVAAMSLGRRSPTVALVLFGAFVLVVTSVCPRGMLRALALSQLERPPAPAGVVVDTPADAGALRLPSVRVSVAREDDEVSGGALALHLDLVAEAAPTEAVGEEPRPVRVVPDDATPCTDAPAAPPCGDRAPPSVV
jgi:hypothetical protein